PDRELEGAGGARERRLDQPDLGVTQVHVVRQQRQQREDDREESVVDRVQRRAGPEWQVPPEVAPLRRLRCQNTLAHASCLLEPMKLTPDRPLRRRATSSPTRVRPVATAVIA